MFEPQTTIERIPLEYPTAGKSVTDFIQVIIKAAAQSGYVLVRACELETESPQASNLGSFICSTEQANERKCK